MTVEVPGNSTFAVIGGLNPELQYSVTVSTSTSEGAGTGARAVVPCPQTPLACSHRMGVPV